MLGRNHFYILFAYVPESYKKLCIYSNIHYHNKNNVFPILVLLSHDQTTSWWRETFSKRTKPPPQQYKSNISCGLCNNTIFHYRLDYNVNTMTLSKIKGKQTLMRVGRLNMGTLMSTSVEMLLSIVHALTRAPPVSFLTVVRRESMRIGWTSLVYFSISKIQCLRY